ncbi:MAG TPA: PQQ-binding-like beta-propeller repeat protein, partial [Polyangiaceae bacterium]
MASQTIGAAIARLGVRRSLVPFALTAAMVVAAVGAPACGQSGAGGKGGDAGPNDGSGGAGDHTAPSGDSGSGDAGKDGPAGDARTDASEAGAPCSGPGANPDAWATYGHDARRTSASNACIHTSFTEVWRYPAAGADAAIPPYPLNEIADDASVYVHIQYTGVPTVDKLSAADGSLTWRYNGHADYDGDNWLSLGLGYVMVDDDGVYLINSQDAGLKSTGGVDWWGQNTVDPDRFYVVTTTHGDGPGAFVGAWDVAKGLIWKANQQGGCSPAIGDENGGLAVDTGVVYFAPRYELGTASGVTPDAGTLTFPSGVYAFDGAAGTKKWSVPTSPASGISAGNGMVYLVEGGPALVARSETDGSVAWSAPLGDAGADSVGSSPPLLAQGLVIVATGEEVLAFDATKGTPAWSTPL